MAVVRGSGGLTPRARPAQPSHPSEPLTQERDFCPEAKQIEAPVRAGDAIHSHVDASKSKGVRCLIVSAWKSRTCVAVTRLT